jgi:hypothetical protein
LGTGGSLILFYFWGQKTEAKWWFFRFGNFKELESAVFFLKSNFNSRILGLCLRMKIKAYCITWAGLTLIKLFFKLVEILK